MDMKTGAKQDRRWICDLAGPLTIDEAEALCPEVFDDPAYANQRGVVRPVAQPDFIEMMDQLAGTADKHARTMRELEELDHMRVRYEKVTGRSMEERPDFTPGYARRALMDRDSGYFNRLYGDATRAASKEWRRWMEHAMFWNVVLGHRWLGQEYVPAGAARKELAGMLSLRYGLLPKRFPNVLPPDKDLPPTVRLAVQLGRMDIAGLKKPVNDPIASELRGGALAMLRGDWGGALERFQKVLRTGNTAVYAIAENLHAPILVYAYLCAIRAGAKRQTIQNWGDALQSILPPFCLPGEMEGMVAFLHNLTVLDGIMNRRTMPSYVPDTSSDLACIPLALCFDRLSPQIRKKIGLGRILNGVAKVMEQGQMLLGYYAVQALASMSSLPEKVLAILAPLTDKKVAPLYANTDTTATLDQDPVAELTRIFGQKADDEVELLHWEFQLDTATNTICAIRPRLRATNEMAVPHDLTLNQCAILCREAQDLPALQLARMLERGDAAALRWLHSLAGHPRLRMVYGGRRSRAISLIAEKPVLGFQRKDGALVVALEAREDGVLRRISDTEWAALIHSDLLESMREFFRVRGEDGSITLPDAAADLLFSHYDLLTSCFDVRGTLAHTIAPVEGELRLVATLQQTAGGYGIRLLVRVLSQTRTDLPPGEAPSHMDVKTPAGIVRVDRNLGREREVADQVCRACGLETRDGRYVWQQDSRTAALEILAAMEREGVLLLRDKGEEFRCITVQQEHLRLQARYMGEEWFELGADLPVDEGMVYSLRELLLALEGAEKSFLPVRNGFLRISDPLKEDLQALKALTGLNGRNFGISMAALPALEQATGREWLPRDINERLDAMKAASSLSAPADLHAELRPYQLHGFRWLAERAAAGIGSCLADDMGLGKTVQLIALLLHRAMDGPSLVVTPVSLLSNWQQEMARFAPSLKVTSYRALHGWRVPKAGEVMLVSYGQLVTNLKDFSSVPWNVMALDEAQAVKNPASQRAKAVCTPHATVRVALTGTPVENSGLDLWSLMRFLNPRLFGSKTHFRQTFFSAGAPYPLRNVVAPLILRRTKAEVLPQLPPLTEQVRYVELAEEERAVYESARRNALQKLAEGARDRISVLAELMRLRRACCHAGLVLPEYTGPASKLEEMLDLVLSLRAAGHKALVFSQFTDVLDLVEPLLQKEGVAYERLDGTTSARSRTAAVKRFQEGKAEVFLISLKAGGTGLNLTAADYVLLLDPWWNPAVESQAAGRSHRIGQDSPVTLYRFITVDTVEERVLSLHQEKRELAEAILTDSPDIPLESLRELLAD